MKKRLALLLSALMLLTLCGCGASCDTAAQEATAAEAPAAMYAAADAVPAEPAMEYGGFAVAGSAALNSTAAARGEEAASQNGPDKIIYSADATVETTDFDGSIEKLGALVESWGGWIESSSINGSNYYNQARGRISNRSAAYTLRIPSDNFSALMSALSTLGNVPYSHTYTENVSAQYYDTEARLSAYRTQEQRLLELMELAESVEDVIAIEERLTELRYQIESLQGSLNHWDRQVSYSRVSLSIDEVEEYTPQAAVQPSYGEKLLRAMGDGLSSLGRFFSDLLLILVEALPTLLLIAVLIFAAVKLIKGLRRSKARKKADHKSDSETD